MKVLFVVNNVNYFISHRLAVGKSMLDLGHDVYVAAPDECPQHLLDMGFGFIPIKLSRKGKNVFNEILSLVSFIRVFRKVEPDLVHLVTIKPYLYGGVAARLTRVPCVVSAVAGLGILFSDRSLKNLILRSLLFPIYLFAFNHKNQQVIFQNTSDRDCLIDWGVLKYCKTNLIRGAGVDLNDYSFLPEPVGRPIISLASRLLKDKGVTEFAEASRLLKNKGVEAEFWLIGSPDLGNRNTIRQNQLDTWEQLGLVKCLGYRSDVAELFAKSNIVCLPSYYGEGLPKVLIEAAACGRAVVTTDHPGCRDAIEHNTGILVPVKDAQALADAIESLILFEDRRKRMGECGRLLAEEEFTIDQVVSRHLDIYTKLFIKVHI